MILFFIIVFIVSNGIRFYMYPNEISSATQKYFHSRVDRLSNESNGYAELVKEVLEISSVASELMKCVGDSIDEFAQGCKNKFDNKKLEQIMDKFMEVRKYVTGKYE